MTTTPGKSIEDIQPLGRLALSLLAYFFWGFLVANGTRLLFNIGLEIVDLHGKAGAGFLGLGRIDITTSPLFFLGG